MRPHPMLLTCIATLAVATLASTSHAQDDDAAATPLFSIVNVADHALVPEWAYDVAVDSDGEVVVSVLHGPVTLAPEDLSSFAIQICALIETHELVNTVEFHGPWYGRVSAHCAGQERVYLVTDTRESDMAFLEAMRQLVSDSITATATRLYPSATPPAP